MFLMQPSFSSLNIYFYELSINENHESFSRKVSKHTVFDTDYITSRPNFTHNSAMFKNAHLLG